MICSEAVSMVCVAGIFSGNHISQNLMYLFFSSPVAHLNDHIDCIAHGLIFFLYVIF